MMGIGFQVARGGHDTGGSQHLSTGLKAGKPAVIAAASGSRGTTAITKPAAGPAESCQNGSGAKIHQRSRPPCAGDDVGRVAWETCPPGVYEWRGKLYRGQREVSAASGCALRTIQYHLGRYGHLKFLGVGSSGPNRFGHSHGGKPIILFGREWPSRAALAAETGKAESTVRRRLCEGRLDLIMQDLLRADAARMADVAKERSRTGGGA